MTSAAALLVKQSLVVLDCSFILSLPCRNGLSGEPYLYTLSLAAPENSWGVLGPLFQQSADSFRLLPTGREYVPPDKDPWRFF